MEFEKSKLVMRWGTKAGFVLSYFLFTSVLFGILVLFKKLDGMNYAHILGITLLITFTGIIIRRILQ